MSVIDRIDLNTAVASSTVGEVSERTGVRSDTDPREIERSADFERALDSFMEGQNAPAIAEEPAASEAAELPVADVEFSRHALARMKSRGIEISPQDMADISDAVDRLAGKGVRESLLLLGDHALIVGVPKRTVITAMTRNEAVGSIFTNIDSTLVLK